MKVLYADISVRSRVWATAMENFFSQRDSQDYTLKNVHHCSNQRPHVCSSYARLTIYTVSKSPGPKMRETIKPQRCGTRADTAVM